MLPQWTTQHDVSMLTAQDWRDTRSSYHACPSWAVKHACCPPSRKVWIRIKSASNWDIGQSMRSAPLAQAEHLGIGAKRRAALRPARRKQLCVPARHKSRSPRSSLAAQWEKSTQAGHRTLRLTCPAGSATWRATPQCAAPSWRRGRHAIHMRSAAPLPVTARGSTSGSRHVRLHSTLDARGCMPATRQAWRLRPQMAAGSGHPMRLHAPLAGRPPPARYCVRDLARQASSGSASRRVRLRESHTLSAAPRPTAAYDSR